MGIWETIWKSILLGTVQGLTEFLPVSSSGHLELLRTLLKVDFGSEAAETFFDVMMHVGTLFAVLVVFRKSVAALFRPPLKPLGMLAAATVPAGLAGIAASLFDLDEKLLALGLLPAFFLVTALVLLLAEFLSRKRRRTEPLGWKQTLAMGFAQAVAILPGISRSGSTIAAGVAAGGKREEVAKFTFLMSIPVILGAALVSAAKVFVHRGELAGADGLALGLGIAVGAVCAAAAGSFAVKAMLKIIGAANYKWFSLYLVLLSLTCIWLQVIGIL